MIKKHLVIVGNPVPEDWEFQRGLQKETGQEWQVMRCCINEYTGLKKYTRYLKYVFFPLYLIAVRNRYEKIISWEQFFGLVMAFYMRVLHIRNCPPMDVMTFIYRPKKGWVGKIYYRFVYAAVTSRYIRKIYVFGKSEIDHYVELFGVPKEKFASELLGIADMAIEINALPKAREDRFYLSAGRSNRDYDFLRTVWEKQNIPLCIVCDVETAEDTAAIHYEKNCHGNEYLRLLTDSYAVIVPLLSEKFSSGQLVVLQAAMLGKPVIVTQNDTVRDYVDDGETGFIIPKTEQALLQALHQLDDPICYARICKNARRKFEQCFSLYELGCRVGCQQKVEETAATSWRHI